MSGLKQLRNRIKSIKSTQKLTKAMQMVSASKLKKIKDNLGSSDDYLKIIKEIITDLSLTDIVQDLSPLEQKFFKNDNETKSHLLIVMTSERGLCGSFNSSIIKKVKNDIAKHIASGEKFKIIVIGRKGYDLLQGSFQNYIDDKFPQTKNASYNLIKTITQKIFDSVSSDEVNHISIYYNKFKNALTQISSKEQIMPLVKTEMMSSDSRFIYEYEGEKLLSNLIGLYFQGQLNYSFLQNMASEEGARMTAMDNATKNAGEIVSNLTLKMNRSRQAIITKELTEIIAGAESV